MNALSNGTDSRLMILGVGNADADDVGEAGLLIPQLRADAIVEVPCTADANGIHPQRPALVTGPELGLITAVKACEELVIDAAFEGDVEKAWQALASHPLVDSVDVAREVLAAYMRENPDIARVFA
ncbi:hypothetical protein [Trueperella pyogenes]